MSRGDRREDISLDDVDRQDFLKTLAEAYLKTAWEVHRVDRLLGEHGIPRDTASGRAEFQLYMEIRRR